MKHFNIFQELSISKIFSTEEIFRKYWIFSLTSTFAYAKILNKISNEGERSNMKTAKFNQFALLLRYSG